MERIIVKRRLKKSQSLIEIFEHSEIPDFRCPEHTVFEGPKYEIFGGSQNSR
ncbi:hypothetical protein [Methanobacterium sp. A39]|uniref:hypothetical protein n=1 Tax=Methanobacterium sp. A39 TaxID=1860100 RepID=UPI001C4054E2|nr:hypothetical protein [Methanobacterium sp. A39]